MGITTDASGNVLLTGNTSSSDGIATTGAYQEALVWNGDAFVAMFSSTGSRVWGAYFGGTGIDKCNGIATDASGCVLVIGNTYSDSGISTSGAHQSSFGGSIDAFVGKFDSTGNLLWCTYYGGAEIDEGWGIATDSLDNIIIIGWTGSYKGIASQNAHKTYNSGWNDAFVAKFSSMGVRQWGTYFGGGNSDAGFSIAVDIFGNIIAAGGTHSIESIATSSTHQTSGGGNADAFVVKFSSAGTRLWGTYYGGNEHDEATGITADASGNILLVGSTYSTTGIATEGVHQTTLSGKNDGYLVSFNKMGKRNWATYYGGPGRDILTGITLDTSRNILVTGHSSSKKGIATTDAFKPIYSGENETIIAKFSPNQTSSIAGTALAQPSISIYPNPFAQDFSITYTLTRPGNVTLELLDFTGRKLISKYYGLQPTGEHTTTLASAGNNLPKGVYLLKMQIGAQVIIQKVVKE